MSVSLKCISIDQFSSVYIYISVKQVHEIQLLILQNLTYNPNSRTLRITFDPVLNIKLVGCRHHLLYVQEVWPPYKESSLWKLDNTSWSFCTFYSLPWICQEFQVSAMVLILDGHSEIDAHVRSNLCFFTCIRLLISSRAGKIGKDLLCIMRAQHVMSYHLI